MQIIYVMFTYWSTLICEWALTFGSMSHIV